MPIYLPLLDFLPMERERERERTCRIWRRICSVISEGVCNRKADGKTTGEVEGYGDIQKEKGRYLKSERA